MIDWRYYAVEHGIVVRADLKEMRAERLMRDGRWANFPDLMDITYNGRQLAGEAEAMADTKDLFAMHPELRVDAVGVAVGGLEPAGYVRHFKWAPGLASRHGVVRPKAWRELPGTARGSPGARIE